MLAVILDPTASAIVATASYSGLRKGEIEALRWEDWRDGCLWVSRAIWNGITLEPKTSSSAAPVPVIPSLARQLAEYRLYLGNPIAGPMFPGSRCGKPTSLNNVLNRTIKPALKAAGLPWHGWHGYRRGLASNLHALKVPDKTIQAILRHSNVQVTQACYIKSKPEQAVQATDSLETALCAERALKQRVEENTETVN